MYFHVKMYLLFKLNLHYICSLQASQYTYEVTYVKDHDTSNVVRKAATDTLIAFGINYYTNILLIAFGTPYFVCI